MAELILFNKPFRVLSQFSDREQPEKPRATLADYLKAPEFRAAGRLDFDSEGLLLLTNDGLLQQQIANPASKTWKTYWVQVEGQVAETELESLRQGVVLKDGLTLPARARALPPSVPVWPREPPIRQRREIADSWLELQICEGRNRQVRRMTASVGLPTLRLVRVAIGDWSLDQLLPGESRRIQVHMPKTARSRRRRPL
jgi:23S rRNA pseudouridine2457 synthase